MGATAIGRLRLVGLAEGTSFLVLLLVAMPLKYLAGQPLAVQVVGSLHGGLFLLYLVAAVVVARRHRWGVGRTLAALAASVLPAGPFVFDRSLRREQDAVSPQAPTPAAAR